MNPAAKHRNGGFLSRRTCADAACVRIVTGHADPPGPGKSRVAVAHHSIRWQPEPDSILSSPGQPAPLRHLRTLRTVPTQAWSSRALMEHP